MRAHIAMAEPARHTSTTDAKELRLPQQATASDGTAAAEGADGGDPTHARRWWILAVVGLAQLMTVLDATAVNIALPSVQKTQHFSNNHRIRQPPAQDRNARQHWRGRRRQQPATDDRHVRRSLTRARRLLL
jgi:hypothetical protein